MLKWRVNKNLVILSYMALNFALLEADVIISHSQNSFFRLEWIPIVYAPLAVVSILTRLAFAHQRWPQALFRAIMWAGVAVGLGGTFFHLAGNATAQPESLNRLLVQGSPVAAPIAFAGVALYSLASGNPIAQTRRRQQLALVGWGFLGAVLAAFFDHARLSFIPAYTLLPLISGIMAALTCFWTAWGPSDEKRVRAFLLIMAFNVAVGLLGFAFHVMGDLAGSQALNPARFLYRDPLLGPLLFCNLGILAGLTIFPDQESVEPDFEGAALANS